MKLTVACGARSLLAGILEGYCKCLSIVWIIS
jgi:hypothetical protein